MDALVSGQAGVALLIQGNDVSAIEAHAEEKEYPSSVGSIPYILDGATDVIELRAVTRTDVVRSLQTAWSNDRALQLVLILLDQSEDIDNRKAAAACASELLVQPNVFDYVANRFYSAPLPSQSDVSTALNFSADAGLLSLLRDLQRDQKGIERTRAEWDGISSTLFESQDAKEDFRKVLVTAGAFRKIVQALNDIATFGMASIQCYRSASGFPNHRQILNSWLTPLRPSRANEAVVRPESENNASQERVRPHQRQIKVSRHELFENVQKQKQGIIELLRKGDLARARSYVEQLVDSQLASGGPMYAAKSLCALSQEAKEVKNYSLQLELAKKAVEVAPEDGWAHGQVADAYVCLGQYDNALGAFHSAETFGERAFASLGRARVLRLKGRLDDALRAFNEAIQLYPEELSGWLGRAEVLRDMWRLDEALGAYISAIERFPYEPIPRCGRAAVLKDMGHLRESLLAYEDAARDFTNEPVPVCGRADVLKELGRMDDSLDAYSKAINQFPDEPVARCGYAEVMKVSGRLNEALEAYSEAAAMFPYETVPYSGRAETLKALERYEDSLNSYDEGLRKFPYETRLWTGKADALKRLGRFRDSLRAYDEIIRLFPYDIVAWSGRADLLKELGELKEAAAAYDFLVNQYPAKQNFKNAKAAVLAALGRYEQALILLPAGEVHTRDEWIGQHIKGTISMKRGNLDQAIKLFQDAIAKIPFALERNYFENALAVAQLRLRKFDKAIVHLRERREPLTTILRVHALAGMAKFDDAKNALTEADRICPKNLIPLKNELAAHFKLSPTARRHNSAWIFDQECRNLLLEAA